MNEGLFADLKKQNKEENAIFSKKEKNTFGLYPNENINFETKNFTNNSDWDGTPLPLTHSYQNDMNNYGEVSVGLPTQRSAAPWEAQVYNSNNTSYNNDNSNQPAFSTQSMDNSQFLYQSTNNNGNNGYFQPMQQQNNLYDNGIQSPYFNGQNQPQMSFPNNNECYYQQPSNMQNYENPYQSNMGINQIPNYNFGNTGMEIEKSNDHIVIDKVANLNYINAGKNNIVPGSSQYGLCDVSGGEWMKQGLLISIPIFNIFYIIYIGYLSTFCKYPTLKEWARGFIFNVILSNLVWIMTIYTFILLFNY